VEAAHIAWRPLGQLLVEQGMLTSSELELALAKQQETGKRLGETIVACGFVSGPELENALAAQYGIVLTTEKGFGTGLRSEIQRRHESDRRKVVQLTAVPDVVDEPEPAPSEPGGDALLLAQLEEQWAKLAAAEAALSERERELEEVKREHGERLHELRRLEELNARLREQIEELRRVPDAAADPAPAVMPEPPTSHLVFVQLDGRYELVLRDGPPPLARTELTLPDVDNGLFVVSGSRRSPLPGDSRPCVVAQRA
jgi:hypothetical protein